MANVSIKDDIIEVVISRMPPGSGLERTLKNSSSTGHSSEALITRWLEKLLRHFGIHELNASSDQRLIELLTGYERGQASDFYSSALQDDAMLMSLKRRIVRLAGAQLDTTFVSMAPEVVSLEDTEVMTLNVESRLLKGVRYQGEVYRLVEAFAPCHRLQAFCLGQTMEERGTAYLMTQSSEAFAVWVNVRALPRSSYQHHLPS